MQGQVPAESVYSQGNAGRVTSCAALVRCVPRLDPGESRARRTGAVYLPSYSGVMHGVHHPAEDARRGSSGLRLRMDSSVTPPQPRVQVSKVQRPGNRLVAHVQNSIGSYVENQATHAKIRSFIENSAPGERPHYKVNLCSHGGVDAPAAHKLAIEWRTLPGAPRVQDFKRDASGHSVKDADGQWELEDGVSMWPEFPAEASGRLEMKTVHHSKHAAEFLWCSSLRPCPPPSPTDWTIENFMSLHGAGNQKRSSPRASPPRKTSQRFEPDTLNPEP